jgi:serine protease
MRFLWLLIVCLGFHASAAQAAHPKAGSRSATVAPEPEQLVQKLIVTPHRSRGEKLSAQLDGRDASKLAGIANVTLSVERRLSGRAHLLRLAHPVSLAEARAIVARLRISAEVESAEPDLLMQADSLTPDDPSYASWPSQWHYMAPAGSNAGGADLPAAWDMSLGSANIDVAVIDTGYRPHPDLGPMLPGFDFVSSTAVSNDGDGRDSDAQDPGDWVAAGECGSGSLAANSSWHGTHVMGTIAALMNNGIGGTGIAPHVRILPLRVLGKCGGYTSDIVDAMRWAVGIDVPGVPHNRYPARILNLSLGSSGVCSASFQSAINDVNAAGAIVVIASGNAGADTVYQPANCSGVIAVTAHTIDGDNADYANIGPEVTVSAPGGGCGTLSSGCAPGISSDGLAVYSLSNTGLSAPLADSYAIKRGTSMAAPHVCGTIALMLSLAPDLTRAQVTSMLRASARAHPATSTCALPANAGLCGAGLLDAQAALTAIVPTMQITQPHQVVSPAAAVALSGTALPASSRTIVSYQWQAASSNPAPVMLADANTANASFIAPATGTYLFILYAVDSSGAMGSATASIRVNSPPVLQVPAASQLNAGTSLQLQLQATDVDADLLVFHAATLPAGASLTAGGLFSWLNAAPVGSYDIVYYASDDYSSSAPGTLKISITPSLNITSVAAPAGGGGGSMEADWWLVGTALLAIGRRLRRRQ